jgi:transposase
MSNEPGVLIKDVAESLCIHPFMLSRWRKQVRDGELVGKAEPIEPQAVSDGLVVPKPTLTVEHVEVPA